MIGTLARSARARFVAGSGALCLAAALLATWDVLGRFGSASMAGGAPAYGETAHGDYLQSGYRLWLFGRQLGDGHLPWIDPYSFQPESPHQIGLGGWPFGLLMWPVYALASPIVAWNVFTVLAIAAGGWLACWWLRELGLGRGAALVGGLAFALAPYRLEQSTGHLLGPISILLPLALACFERGLRGSRAWHLGAAGALVSLPLSGQVHLALGAVPFFAFYALCRTRDRRDLRYAAAATVLGALGGILIQQAVIARSIVAGGRDFHALTQYSAHPLDLLSRDHVGGSEQFVFLGGATLLLALAGLVVLVRLRRWGIALALGVGTIVPAAAALGSNLPLYRFAWHHSFVLRYARVPERTLPIACLCLAGLVAFAVDRLARRWPGGAAVTVALAVAIVVVDLHVSVFEPTRADEGNTAYAALRSQGPGRLLELPVFLPGDDHGSVYFDYLMQAPRQRPLGYSTLARPAGDRAARGLWPLNCGVVGSAQRRLIAELGIRFVTLHRGLFRGAGRTDLVAAARAGLRGAGFRRIALGGEVELWRLEGRAKT
ncbi:MAG: hypothetical protein QOH73_502, partial [Gaiellaceae bacterium]|nr:hypothetical protein [Gaiellaceae bacterium]